VKRAETRQRILSAAVRTLAEQGYRGTTARAIAATGGFAPGLIYYHFADLDELFVATAQFTSAARLVRYRAETDRILSAVELVDRLRALHAEDGAEGHIAAVQELIAAATTSVRLAEEVRASTAQWQDFAASVIHRFVDGTPLAPLVPVRELAAIAVATYLGVEMLSHLDANHTDPAAIFDAARSAAAMFDVLRPAHGSDVAP
jgi:AcrR family transcriptional regulator